MTFFLLFFAIIEQSSPLARFFQSDNFQVQAIFDERQENDSILWTALETQAPDLVRRHNFVEIKAGNENFQISVIPPKMEIVESVSKKVEVFTVRFNITRIPTNWERPRIKAAKNRACSANSGFRNKRHLSSDFRLSTSSNLLIPAPDDAILNGSKSLPLARSRISTWVAFNEDNTLLLFALPQLCSNCQLWYVPFGLLFVSFQLPMTVFEGLTQLLDV